MPKPKKSAVAPKKKSPTKKITLAKKKTTAVKTQAKLKPKKKVTVKRKAKKISVVPKGYNSVTPYLIVESASKAIEFYKKVFGAKEMMRMEHPGGKVGHAELKIGDAKIMLADVCPEMDAHSPQRFGGSPISIYLYIKDVDGVVNKAVAAGAKLIKPVETLFYGDRSGVLEDPSGHRWLIATHVEDVTPAQMKKRIAELFNKK
jgi:PhnB protein